MSKSKRIALKTPELLNSPSLAFGSKSHLIDLGISRRCFVCPASKNAPSNRIQALPHGESKNRKCSPSSQAFNAHQHKLSLQNPT
ncbi:hypothetical protein M758_12G133900 [Ceratodon purpureus]|nr:hypothetical protein M758_12G133900 [Ceratodon purpureus]